MQQVRGGERVLGGRGADAHGDGDRLPTDLDGCRRGVGQRRCEPSRVRPVAHHQDGELVAAEARG
ncbi:MAG TPA: hypothetical protein PKB06_05500, partial [Actinotalea sp.]|nr:hypothetical protein [Actinotalea sp.]